MSDPASAARSATQATVRFALAQGYLAEAQVREALLIKQQLDESGQRTELLAILGNRYLSKEHLPELTAVYQRTLQRKSEAQTAATDSFHEKIAIPDAMLARSVEMMRRPAEDDPDDVRSFMRESEGAKVTLPTIEDRTFVSLAKKAGYPQGEELVRCRRIQLEAKERGETKTLFDVVRDEGILSDRRVNRFLRWNAQISRKDQKPLLDEESPERRQLAQSAASFQATVERCGRCGIELDDLAVMEGRARTTPLGLECVPCKEGAPASPGKIQLQVPGSVADAPAPPRRRGRVRRAFDKSREIVVSRFRRKEEAAEAASRRTLQAVVVTAGLFLVALLGLGLTLLVSKTDPPPPPPEWPTGPGGTPDTASSGDADTQAADGAWFALRRAEPADLAAGLREFALRYPGDRRSADARHFAKIFDALENAVGSGGSGGGDAAQVLFDEAERLRANSPAQAGILYGRVKAHTSDRALLGRAEARLRELRVASLQAVTALRKKAAQVSRISGPTAALEDVVKNATSKWEGLDGGGFESLVATLLRDVERAGPAKTQPIPLPGQREPPVEPKRESRRPAQPPPASKPPTATKVEVTTSTPTASRLLYDELFDAYYARDRAAVSSIARKIEAVAGADSPEAHAARGFELFLQRKFPEAIGELEKGADSNWRRTVQARAHFFRHEYERALAVLTEEDKTQGIGKTLTLLIAGPFQGEHGAAAPALEGMTPEGRYRVVTDVGLRVVDLRALRAKLAKSPSAAESAKSIRAFQRRHRGLQEAAAIMDKAYTAFDKLFALGRPSEIVPTVYIFARRAGFDAFSTALGTGATEHTLGYYLPSYRVLVFYDQGGAAKGRAISQDTLQVLLHETFHQWLHLYVDTAPRWFDEGLGEYFGIAEISPKQYRYGLLPKGVPSRLSNIRSALQGLLTRPMPVADMIRADRERFYDPTSISVNYAQAWSFVHFLASDSAGQRRLRAYFQALRGGLGLNAAYEQVFGDVDPDALEKAWLAYLGRLK